MSHTRAGQSKYVRMTPMTYRKLVEALMAGEVGYRELHEATGLKRGTLSNYMGEFLRTRVGARPQRLARVSGWDGLQRPLFSWGEGPDCPRPRAVSATDRNLKYRRGVRAIAHQQQITRALTGDTPA